MAMANATEYCMKIQVPKVSELDEISLPQVSIYGIPWKIYLYKNKIDEQTWFTYIVRTKTKREIGHFGDQHHSNCYRSVV